MEFRRYITSFFPSREAKLRFLRIANDVEQNLATYLATVTVINFGLGVAVAIGAAMFGLPNPFIFGALAMLLNYVPYIGAACMAVILLGVGLVSFPSLGYALLPAVAFVALATLEGQFITPTVLGRRLTLDPFAIFLALAFWAWLWGPLGAFLAVPLSIVGLVTINHLSPGRGHQSARIAGVPRRQPDFAQAANALWNFCRRAAVRRKDRNEDHQRIADQPARRGRRSSLVRREEPSS